MAEREGKRQELTMTESGPITPMAESEITKREKPTCVAIIGIFLAFPAAFICLCFEMSRHLGIPTHFGRSSLFNGINLEVVFDYLHLLLPLPLPCKRVLFAMGNIHPLF